jgi:hypothetical protein
MRKGPAVHVTVGPFRVRASRPRDGRPLSRTVLAVEPDAECELCAAVPFTEWMHSDDLCWIAECDSCRVPMVVWRRHDPNPPASVRTELHARLAAVVENRGDQRYWIDENMRTIPDHYHAHARPRIDWTTR